MSTTSTSLSSRGLSDDEEKWTRRKMVDMATISKVSVTFDNEWGAALIELANAEGMELEEYILNAVKKAIIADGHGPERYVGCRFTVCSVYGR